MYSAWSAPRGWAALALFLGLGAAWAAGQTTWTGAAGDGLWSNNLNWSNNAPTGAGQAVFDGQGQAMTITPINSYFTGSTFTGGSYTFTSTAGAIGISALTVLAGTQTVTSGVSYNSGGTITVASGATLILSSNSSKAVGAATLSGGGDYRIGTYAGTGSLTMNGTGVLTLTGTSGYARPLTMANGTLSLGTSIAARTFSSSVTLDAGSTTVLRLNGTSRGSTYDGLTATNLTYGGTLALNFGSTFADGDVLDLFSATAFTANYSFNAITGTGTYAGNFTNNGGIWTMTSGDRTFTFTESTGDLSVAAATAVPEPSTYAAVAGAGALGLALWRRRRGRAV